MIMYVTLQSLVYSTVLVFEEKFAQTAFAVVSCADPVLSKFFPLFVSIFQPKVCDIPVAHLQGSTFRNRQNIRAEAQVVFLQLPAALF